MHGKTPGKGSKGSPSLMIRFLQKESQLVKILFALIIGGAVISMVITLVPGILDNASTNPDVYATVRSTSRLGRLTGNSTDIKVEEVNMQLNQMLQQQNMTASQIPDFYRPILMKQAAQRVIAGKILRVQAEKLGLKVSDADVMNYLKQGELGTLFFPEGKFIGSDKYEAVVQNQIGMRVQDFEDSIRQDLEIRQLASLVTGSASVSDTDVRASVMQQSTKVKFDYAVISSDDIAKTINPSDTDLQAFFKQDAARYANAIPEQRKIAYFAFDATNLPAGASAVTPQDVQAYYQAHIAEYQEKDSISVKQILIQVPQGADAATDKAAKDKAQDVLNQLQHGANFGDLAKKYSDDPGSKEKGGEYDNIPKGTFVPEFEQAAYALNPGQLSGLVKTNYGYHIIQLISKTPAKTHSLDEEKDAIQATLQQQKVGQAEQTFAQQLADEAQKTGLQKTADAHHLKLVTTDFLAQDGTIGGLSDGTQLLAKAFATTQNAAPQFAPTGEGFAVFQVTALNAAHTPDFATFKPTLLKDYRTEKLPQLVSQKTIALSARAHELNDLKKAAAEVHAAVKSTDLIGRDGTAGDLGPMTGAASAAFSLNQGQISGPLQSSQNGFVLEVTQKQSPAPEEIAKQFESTREQMLEQSRNELFQIYMGGLMDKYVKAGAIVYSKAVAAEDNQQVKK
jgi:peptidyl-prolyl cis-trans isomerase D